MADGPRRHQAGERRTRRSPTHGSTPLRGANVQASAVARHLDGTARQRNRHFNPLGTHHRKE